jgi:rare lipoprotein A
LSDRYRGSRLEGPGRVRPGRPSGALALILVLAGAACSSLPRPTTGGLETGVASWYGGEFHGRQTSSREVYDMNDMTAAHRTLPFGTYLMVTNLDNDRSAVVRINDRGPFVKGRIIDLSYAAARVLGIVGPGTARVRLDVLGGFKAPDMTGQRPAGVWIQVGAFSVQESAYTIMHRLEKTYPGVAVSQIKTANGTYFRVRVRTDEAGAKKLAERLAGEGYPVIIVRE